MDKKNLLPNQGAPVIRGISGKLPSHLAELSEEALVRSVLETSHCVSVCAFDGAEASDCVSVCAFDGDEASGWVLLSRLE